MNQRWDILGLGCTTVDDLLYVETYPAADSKTRVQRTQRQCGGLTATALVAAARLGARRAFAGVLGHDELSRFVEATLKSEKVDTSPVVRRDDAQPAHSRIVVAASTGSRNIFYEVTGAMGADEQAPPEETIRAARVLFLDQYGMKGNLRAARFARAAGIAVVSDLEDDADPLFAEVFALVDHAVLSEEFALKITGAKTAEDAVLHLCGFTGKMPGPHDRQAVVVTCGARGSWYLDPSAGSKAVHFPAFPVQAVDTTGCGDVFHGAYAAALALGLDLQERVRFAAAAAALKATRPGGQGGIPQLNELQDFLTQQDSWKGNI